MTSHPPTYPMKEAFDEHIRQLEILRKDTFLTMSPNNRDVFRNVYAIIDPFATML